MTIADQARARFTSQYSNVAFGWSIATAFADARLPFPMPVYGRDNWLYDAYLLRIDCVKYRNAHVIDAWALANLAEARKLRGKVCGLLLSGCGQPPDEHRRAVAAETNINFKTIEAFDTLFYNILDRHEDSAFLSEQVYPDSRFIEFAEDYVKNADIADLIKRAGYNHRDLKMSSFLAGIGDSSYMARLSARTDREQELTRHLMGNALLLVHSGALNQRSVGMARAQTLLAAQRQSGQTVDLPPVADAGQYMADPLRAALAAQDAQRVAIAKEDSGK